MVTDRARLNVDPDVVSAIENLVATRRSEIKRIAGQPNGATPA
jgi:hypothetical protein